MESRVQKGEWSPRSVRFWCGYETALGFRVQGSGFRVQGSGFRV